MTDYVQEPSRYWVEADRQGDATAPRWFQMDDGQLHPVTPQIADWVCRAWDHEVDVKAYHATYGAFERRLEEYNRWSDDLDAASADITARQRLAVRGKRGLFNPLGILDIASDLRDLKSVDGEVDPHNNEVARFLAVGETLAPCGGEIDAWTDRVNERCAAINNEAALLGTPPVPQAYPVFAFAMLGRSPQVLTTPPELPSLAGGGAPSTAGYAAPPIYQAPPEPTYEYPAVPAYGTSPAQQYAPQPAPPQPAAAPNPSSSNVFDDLI